MILCVNVGSSSARLALFEHGKALAQLHLESSPPSSTALEKWLAPHLPSIGAVAHRFVHGGDRFTEPTLLTPSVRAELDALSALAPLHNPPSLALFDLLSRLLPSRIPHLAIFDTAFHRTMPPHAALYALPASLGEGLGIRRFGFHGIAHSALAQRIQSIRPSRRLITLHLGSGCSACAILDGVSLDTSMGWSPAEGLMMSTRSGDLDPTLPAYLAIALQQTPAQITQLLTQQSGWAGVSGLGTDMRVLLSSASSNPTGPAALAIDIFCYRVRKIIGAYAAVLNGLDTLVFSGGIGENAPSLRARICVDFDWLGLHLDSTANADASQESWVHTPDSRVAIAVIASAEMHSLAHVAAQFFSPTSKENS